MSVCRPSLHYEQQASWHLGEDGLAYQTAGTTLHVSWQLPLSHGVNYTADMGIIRGTKEKEMRVEQRGTGNCSASHWELLETAALHSGIKPPIKHLWTFFSSCYSSKVGLFRGALIDMDNSNGSYDDDWCEMTPAGSSHGTFSLLCTDFFWADWTGLVAFSKWRL